MKNYVQSLLLNPVSIFLSILIVFSIITPVNKSQAQISYGYLQGTVTDEAGEPANYAHVYIKPVNGTIGSARSTTTNTSGQYYLYPETGEWTIEFERYGGAGYYYKNEWYSDKTDEAGADIITIVDSETTIADAKLTRNGEITGRLWSGMGAINDACVDLYEHRVLGGGQEYSQYFVSSTTADSAGYFSFHGLKPMNYTLFYRDCDENSNLIHSEWYNHKNSYQEADIIKLQFGQMHKNIGTYTLTIQSIIEGRLVNTDSEPIEGMCVELGLTNNIPATYYPYLVARTDADGRFIFNDLEYQKIYYWTAYECDTTEYSYFRGPVKSAYLYEWGQSYMHYIAPDETMVRFSSISGLVTDSQGNPIAGIRVKVEGQGWTGNNTGAITKSDGTYLVNGIAPVANSNFGYKITFECFGTCAYDSYIYPEKQPITQDNTHITGIDAMLYKKTSIQGFITDDTTGYPLAGITIGLYKDGTYIKQIYSYGSFGFTALEPGNYTLHFVDNGYGCYYNWCARYPDSYQDHWYRRQRTESRANTITLNEGDNPYFNITMLPWGQYFFIPVDIDVKPDNAENKINCTNQNGEIPVALLSTETFDATSVIQESIAFGPDGAGISHKKPHAVDANYDGLIDLVMHFKFGSTGLSCGDEQAEFTASTTNGDNILGSDSIFLFDPVNMN